MKFFNKLICKVAATQIKVAREEGFRAAVKQHTTDKFQAQDNYYLDLYNNNLKGRKVIYCPNEWTDPTFAIITGASKYYVSGQVMVESTDVITKESVLLHPNSFYFADELLTMSILKLNPFERWNMSCGKQYHNSNMWTKSYSFEKTTSKDKLELMLREVGFLFKLKTAYWWLENFYDPAREYFTRRNDFTYNFSQQYEDGTYNIFVQLKGNHMHTIAVNNEEELKEFKIILQLNDQTT